MSVLGIRYDLRQETERKYLAFEKDIKWRGSPLKAIFDGLF